MPSWSAADGSVHLFCANLSFEMIFDGPGAGRSCRHTLREDRMCIGLHLPDGSPMRISTFLAHTNCHVAEFSSVEEPWVRCQQNQACDEQGQEITVHAGPKAAPLVERVQV